jgi:hypothetical protein
MNNFINGLIKENLKFYESNRRFRQVNLLLPSAK